MIVENSELQLMYNPNLHLFENSIAGPPELGKKQEAYLLRLISEIEALKDNGASVAKEFFGGARVEIPFGVASGSAYGSKFLKRYEELGYGFVTQKTVRVKRWSGNPMPHVMHVGEGDYPAGFKSSDTPTTSLANSFGMSCLGPGFWEPDLSLFVKTSRVPLIISGVVTEPKDKYNLIDQYASIASAAKKIGAVAFEANVSCPNEMEGRSGELQDDTPICTGVIKEIKRFGFPVLIKIGYKKDLSPIVAEIGKIADGIVAINTISARITDAKGGYAYVNREKAGVSGRPLKPYAEDALKQLVSLREEFGYRYKIFSVGGVTSGNDVLSRLLAGADFVESAAMAMLYPPLALETKKILLENCDAINSF